MSDSPNFRKIANLDGVESLLTARHCEPQQGRRTSPESRGGRETFAQFAKRGIAGLSNTETVSRHWRAWDDAINTALAQEVKRGDTITIPDLPWPKGNTDRKAPRARYEVAAERHAESLEALAKLIRKGIKSFDEYVPLKAAIVEGISNLEDLDDEL